ARPNPTSAHRGQPINLHVKLTNVTSHDAYLWLFFKPTASGADTDMGCLMMRCRNQKTGKDVRYRFGPPGRTTQDAQMKELVDKIPAGSSTSDTINLTDWCDLPPGSYLVELQYETQHIPKWIKPDKRAWHGVTNKVLIKVHVLKRLRTKHGHLYHGQKQQEHSKVLLLPPP
ncbi:MAG: hypothetical protein JWQ02_2755, partial [Capsulimonas sp.]|nr:hypothetical protein [Capsulimonas sp.]